MVIGVSEVRSVTDETAGRNKLAEEVHRWQRMPFGQRDDPIATGEEEWVCRDDQRSGSSACGREGWIEIVLLVSFDHEQRKPQRARGRLHVLLLPLGAGSFRICEQGNSRCGRHQLPAEFKTLSL